MELVTLTSERVSRWVMAPDGKQDAWMGVSMYRIHRRVKKCAENYKKFHACYGKGFVGLVWHVTDGERI